MPRTRLSPTVMLMTTNKVRCVMGLRTEKLRVASMAMVATLVAMIAGLLGAVHQGTAYADITGSVTFSQPGPTSWTVPAGVDTAVITVRGAGGGRYGNPYVDGHLGGAGGEVSATVTVYPGETLSLLVGANDAAGADHHPTGLGGIGGGGNAGRCTGLANTGCLRGAGGGGGSSVYRGLSPLLIAGGGGGASWIGNGGNGGS